MNARLINTYSMNVAARFISRRFEFTSAGSAYVKRNRFYKEVGVIDESEAGKTVYKVTLDGRVLKTQGGKHMKIPSQPLALAIAEEWASQEEHLDIGNMRLTGLAFTAIDNPLHCTKESITSKVLEYLENDTVLFYNDESSTLHREQETKWTPLLTATNEELGTSLKPITNLFETETITAKDKKTFEKWLMAHNLWSLHGIQYAVESVKSVIIPFNVLRFRLTAPQAVELSVLERKVQSEMWGEVEWHHGMEDEQLLSRLSGAVLFTYFTSNTESMTKL